MTSADYQRQARRFATSIAVNIIANRREYPGVMKDISTLGCCVSGAFEVEKGDEIVVVVGGMSIVATVAWARDGLAGANFHKELDSSQMVRDVSGRPILLRRRSANSMTGIS